MTDCHISYRHGHHTINLVRDNRMKLTSVQIGLLILAVVVVVGLLWHKEGYRRYSQYPLAGSCEFQPACLYDTARWVQLSNGMEGVCTLHGLACPAFSKDHDAARNMGLSPTMVDDRYMKELNRHEGYLSGQTALDIGNYPTNTN